MRLGDPEAQVVLPMLDEPLSWLLGKRRWALPRGRRAITPEANVGVVLAAAGYPEAVRDGPPDRGDRRSASCGRRVPRRNAQRGELVTSADAC